MKKLQVSESLHVAHEVLKLIRLSDEAAFDVSQVIGYENGREHGLQVSITPHAKTSPGSYFKERITIFWAQYRMSDAIVVYVSEPGAEGLTEKAYRAGEHFAYNAKGKAAAFISKILNQAAKR